MSERRLFCSRKRLREGLFTVTGDEAHHGVTVCHLRPGDEVFIFTEQGSEFKCEVEAARPGKLTARIVEKLENTVEPDLEITLLQALPKAARMEQIIVHGTELGISRLIPVVSARSIVKGARRDRWRRLALEAAKLSGRRRIPLIEPVVKLEDLDFEQFRNALKLLAAEPPHGGSLREAIESNRDAQSIAVVIGPEGGFAEEELTSLEAAGFLPVTMGPRILRTQTASLVMLSVLLYELGDWNRKDNQLNA